MTTSVVSVLFLLVVFLPAIFVAYRYQQILKSDKYRGTKITKFQAFCFWGGTALGLVDFVSLLVIKSPWETIAHIAQSEILALAVAPLIILGFPLGPLWYQSPSKTRTAWLQILLKKPRLRRSHQKINRAFGSIPVGIIFSLMLMSWHISSFYSWTTAIGEPTGEIVTWSIQIGSLILGLLFWSQIIPPGPANMELSPIRRVFYLGAVAMLANLADMAWLSAMPNLTITSGSGPTPLAISRLNLQLWLSIVETFSSAILGVTFMVMIAVWLKSEHDKESTGPQGSQINKKIAQR